MNKEVFIPKNSTVIEQAELLADMEARQKGFKRNSPQWQKAKQKYLEDRYFNSSIPHRDNPGTPQVSPDLYNVYTKLFTIQGFLASKVGYDTEKYKFYEKRLRGLITQIANIYLELEYSFNTQKVENLDKKYLKQSTYMNSNYEFSKGKNNSKNEMIKNTILIRQTYVSLLTSLVEGAFQIKKAELNQVMIMAKTEAENTIKNEKGLKTKKFYESFWYSLKSIIRKSLKIGSSQVA